MSNELFDQNQCSLPSIPLLPFDFVPDCTVPLSPGPLFASPDLSLLAPAPGPPGEPGAAGGCGGIGGVTVTTITRPAEFSASVAAALEPLEACDANLRLKFFIPAGADGATGPCSQLQASGALTIGSPLVTPLVTVTTTNTVVDDTCLSTLAFNFRLPAQGSVFSGYVASDVCGTTAGDYGACNSIPVYVWQLGTVVSAVLYLENCCAAPTCLKGGQSVWLTYERGQWAIVSIESIELLPIILTTDMSAGTAQAQAYLGMTARGTAFTVNDAGNNFPNAKTGYVGYAACSDVNTGQWNVLQLQQLAIWLEGTLYGPSSFLPGNLLDTDANTYIAITNYHLGQNPHTGSGNFPVSNPAKLCGKQNSYVTALRRNDGTYSLETVSQQARTIAFTLTADLSTGDATCTAACTGYNDGYSPGKTVTLVNTLQFSGPDGAAGTAKLITRGTHQYAYLIDQLTCESLGSVGE